MEHKGKSMDVYMKMPKKHMMPDMPMMKMNKKKSGKNSTKRKKMDY